jgi:predicted ATPase
MDPTMGQAQRELKSFFGAGEGQCLQMNIYFWGKLGDPSTKLIDAFNFETMA